MTSRHARRSSVALALAAAGTLALTACGGGGGGFSSQSTATQKAGPANLKIMIGSSGDAETAAVKAAADSWAKKSGNTVEVIAASDLGQQLGQAFAGGTPPDVFYTDASRIGDFAKAGNLYAYGDQVKDAGFLPSLVQTFTYDGKLQCAPKDYSTLGLVINTDLWAKAGPDRRRHPEGLGRPGDGRQEADQGQGHRPGHRQRHQPRRCLHGAGRRLGGEQGRQQGDRRHPAEPGRA